MKAFRRLCIAVTAIFILLAVILNFFIIRYWQTDSGLYRVEAKRLADELEDTGTYDLSAYPHLTGVFHASDGELFKTDEHYLIIEAGGTLYRVEYTIGSIRSTLVSVNWAGSGRFRRSSQKATSLFRYRRKKAVFSADSRGA